MSGATDSEIYDAVFGSGAMSYSWWVQVKVVEGPLDEDYEAPDRWVREVFIEDPEDEFKLVSKVIDADDIRAACHKIMRDPYRSRSFKAEARNLVYDADELDLDAPAADSLLQYVMFDGEVVYG